MSLLANLKSALEIEEARHDMMAEQESDIARLTERISEAEASTALANEKISELEGRLVAALGEIGSAENKVSEALMARTLAEAEAQKLAIRAEAAEALVLERSGMEQRHMEMMAEMDRKHQASVSSLERAMHLIPAPALGPMEFTAVKSADGHWHITLKE